MIAGRRPATIANVTSTTTSPAPNASASRVKRGGRRRGRRTARPWGRIRTRTTRRRARRSRTRLGSTRVSPRGSRRYGARAPRRRRTPTCREAGRRARTMSGASASMASSADVPSAASPTTSNPSDSSMARAEARKLGWSSTISTVRPMWRDRGRPATSPWCGQPNMRGRTYVLSILQFSQSPCNACAMVLGSPSTSR